MKKISLFLLLFLQVFLLFASNSPAVIELINQGIDKFETGEYSQAESLFREALKLNPDGEYGKVLLIVAKYYQGDYKAVIDDLDDEDFEEINPSFLKLLEAKSYFLLGEYGNSAEILLELRKEDSCSAEVNIYLADVLAELGYIKNAIKEMKVASKKAKDSFYPFYKIGFYYYSLGAYKSALEYFEKAKAIDPKEFLAYHMIGYAYFAMEEFKKALEETEISLKYAENAEDSLLAYTAFGGIYFIEKDSVNFDKTLAKAKKIDAFKARQDFYWGKYCYNLSKFDDALYFFNKVLESKNESYYPEVYSMMGDIYFFTARPKLGLEYFQKYLDLDLKPEKNITIWNNMGACYAELGEYKKANRYNIKVLKIDPQNIVSLYNIACYYSRLKQKRSMIRYLKKAIKVDAEFVRKNAKTDIDFYDYRADKDFRNLIQYGVE